MGQHLLFTSKTTGERSGKASSKWWWWFFFDGAEHTTDKDLFRSDELMQERSKFRAGGSHSLDWLNLGLVAHF